MSEKLEQLLKTSDVDEQAKVVEQLIAMSNAPVLSMLLLVDTRNGNISIVMGDELKDAKFDMLYLILEETRKKLLSMERSNLTKSIDNPE